MTQTTHLTTKDLAARWQTTPGSLAYARCKRQGPTHIKIGKRVLYRLADIEAYEEQNRVQSK